MRENNKTIFGKQAGFLKLLPCNFKPMMVNSLLETETGIYYTRKYQANYRDVTEGIA